MRFCVCLRVVYVFVSKLNKEDKLLTKEELISKSNGCDGILSSITDQLDADIISKLLEILVLTNFGTFPDFLAK